MATNKRGHSREKIIRIPSNNNNTNDSNSGDDSSSGSSENSSVRHRAPKNTANLKKDAMLRSHLSNSSELTKKESPVVIVVRET